MKKLAIILVAAALVVATGMTAFAGEWKSSDGKWYYALGNGKYYSSCKKEIDGKTYAFDSEGWMITGFVDSELNRITGTDYNAAFSSTYYFDQDGPMHKGWLKVDKTGAPSKYDTYKELWFYYDTSNGKKYACTNGDEYITKTIDGTKYGFDENGVMLDGWGTSDTKSVYTVDGKALTGWQQLVPTAEMSESDNKAGTKRWFYFDSKGVAVKDCCKKIGSSNYLFNEYGILQTGMKSLSSSAGLTSGTYSDWSSVSSSSEDDWLAIIDHSSYSGSSIYYFTENGMQTGSRSIDFGGVNHAFYFKENGKGYNAVKGSKLYVNGGLVKATDSKYVAAYDANGKQYLVDSNGTIIGKGRVADDLGGIWAVNKAGNIGFFTSGDKSDATTWAKGTDANTGSPTFIN